METSLELYHHGVKGQHWGSRNGPPYPLYRKSAYYKKTGKRPPGYTGNKSEKESSSGGGKIGGVTLSDKSASSMYKRERNKRVAKLAGAGLLGVGAARNAVSMVRSSKDVGQLLKATKGTRMSTGVKAGVAAGAGITALSGLAAYGLYRSSKKNKKRMEELSKGRRGSIGGLSDIKRAGLGSSIGVGLSANPMLRSRKKGKIGGYNDDDKRSDIKKKILKGAGIAAGAAALAGAGYLAYKNRAAIGSKAGKLRDDIRFKLGELPGTAKLNQTRIDLKNKILGVGRKAKGLVNEVRTPTSALRNDIRLIGASAKGMASNAGNKVKNVGNNVKNVAAKPGQTVYNKIAGKSKAALNVAKTESQAARKDSRTLKNFIDDNAKAIEKTTIAKRQALAKIRRGEGNIKELNQTANNLAARERALIAKQNTAKALAPRAAADRVSKAEAVRQAQVVFERRNKLGRIAAGATNAGIGLGLAGAAGGAGYGISRLARKRRSRKRRRR